MPTYTLEREGKTATIESPRELTPEELTKVSTQHFGEPEKPKSTMDRLLGTKEEVTATLKHKAEGGVFTNPQGITETAANLVATAPAIAAGGAGLGALASKILPSAAKAAPMVGRALTSGAIAGGERAAQGGSAYDIATSVVKNAALSAGGEGVLKAVGSKVATGKAMELIEQRVGKAAWLDIPLLGKSPVSAKQAMDKLASSSGAERKALIEEIAHAFDVAQGKVGGSAAQASQIFREAVKDPRFTPELATKFADAVRTNPNLLGAFATPVPQVDIPFGTMAIGAAGLAAKEGYGKLTHGILPGVGH